MPTQMPVASVEVVGFKKLKIFDPNRIKKLMLDFVEETARYAQSEIIRKTQSGIFKNPTGKTTSAVKREKVKDGVAVYIDPEISPHAIYQEKGVHEHKMVYLIGARRRKGTRQGELSPIPIKTVEGTIFRWPNADKINAGTQFFHPGYDGKFFFAWGIDQAIKYMERRYPNVVTKIMYE